MRLTDKCKPYGAFGAILVHDRGMIPLEVRDITGDKGQNVLAAFNKCGCFINFKDF